MTAERHTVVGTGFACGDGRYHLFYDTRGPAGTYAIAYAWSEDGLTWVKPELGLLAGDGHAQSNVLDIRPGDEGAWNEMQMCSCGVLHQPDEWRMWAAGYREDADGVLHSQLTLLESADPLHWQMAVDGPVIPNGPPGTFDWGFTRVPCVIKDGDKFRMYYTAGDGKRGWCIGYAESSDGRRWSKPGLGLYEDAGSKDNNIVLQADARRGEKRVAHPWVIRDGDSYRMYYSVTLRRDTYSIGTAASADGIEWVKEPEVVVPRGREGDFDYWYAAIPKVVCDDDGYRMWYTGYNGGAHHAAEPEAYALGHATSSDGVKWTKHEANPILR